MGERDVRNVEASGSIPLTSTRQEGQRTLAFAFSAPPECEKGLHCCRPFCILARPERFELPTPWFVAKYSIQMSYGRLRAAHYSEESGENKSCWQRSACHYRDHSFGGLPIR